MAERRISSTAGTSGALTVSDKQYFAFYSRKANVRVAYDKINLLEYGQTVGRRLDLAMVISPIFLLGKKRKHFLTVGYTDEDGNQQALVFRVDKNDIRAALASLEARTGKRVHIRMKRLERRGTDDDAYYCCLLFGDDLSDQLPKIKRVYVDRLTGGETAAQMRDLIITRLQNAKLFMVTENQDARRRVYARGGGGFDFYRSVQVLGERDYAREFERFGGREYGLAL